MVSGRHRHNVSHQSEVGGDLDEEFLVPYVYYLMHCSVSLVSKGLGWGGLAQQQKVLPLAAFKCFEPNPWDSLDSTLIYFATINIL